MSSLQSRKRYWARSFAGWHEFCDVQPNAAHEALARLQRLGWVSHIVTQNVDRLHSRAGAPRVLELHGTNTCVCPCPPWSAALQSASPCCTLPVQARRLCSTSRQAAQQHLASCCPARPCEQCLRAKPAAARLRTAAA